MSQHTETVRFQTRRTRNRSRRERHEKGLEQRRPARVARLLALAHRFQEDLAAGRYGDYADIARQHHHTRARVTQIMNLLLLAPAIQEAILFLDAPPGRDPISERDLRTLLCHTLDWQEQQRAWETLHVPRCGINDD